MYFSTVAFRMMNFTSQTVSVAHHPMKKKTSQSMTPFRCSIWRKIQQIGKIGKDTVFLSWKKMDFPGKKEKANNRDY
uniref:Uncharacterized protein n=1 Tax=Nelumbo nucifera TaxID=4432 RepID=A0A822ZIH1_NELNU|nr:TPA_asm: hypothetical protein HUJ06_002580 [Nelumbo nucifera]